MQTVIKSVNGYQVMPIEALLNHQRVIYVNGEINEQAAMNVVQQMTYLVMEDSVRPIKLFINSCGGEIDSGMVIYDILQGSPAPIQVYCTGKAYSMAAVLLCCGRHGRYILPHSKVMIHVHRGGRENQFNPDHCGKHDEDEGRNGCHPGKAYGSAFGKTI